MKGLAAVLLSCSSSGAVCSTISACDVGLILHCRQPFRFTPLRPRQSTSVSRAACRDPHLSSLVIGLTHTMYLDHSTSVFITQDRRRRVVREVGDRECCAGSSFCFFPGAPMNVSTRDRSEESWWP
ncbi:hypothetical protein OF83DRAFT_894885 [Amylostereum chailletii]|nr:hypothetical protein OF83DRAFT_894885 [Amylostereum chailletii]